MMKYLNGIKKKTFFLLTGAFLFIVIAGVLYCAAMYAIERKSVSVRNVAAQLLEDTRRDQSVKALRHLVVGTSEERAQLDRYFVAGEDVVGFIEYIESLGRHSGAMMELSSVDVMNTKKKTLAVSFKATGSFESIVYLLALMETLPMSVEIEKVSLRKNEKTGEAGEEKIKTEWEGNFNMRVLSFVE